MPDDDKSVLSAPIVIEPLYACSSFVGVRGARLGADVTLFVNNNDVGTQVVRDPDFVEFTLNVPLKETDKLWAMQTVDGVSSLPPSQLARPRDLLQDYPGGVPQPNIDPSVVYECAKSVAARKIPGSSLNLYINDAFDSRGPASAGTNVKKNSTVPFQRTWGLEVTQTFCGEESERSVLRTVGAAPTSLPALVFKGGKLDKDQDRVTIESVTYGAELWVEEASLGIIHSKSSWPWSSHTFNLSDTRLRRAYQPSDDISMRQKLCTVTSPPSMPLPSVTPCEELAPPQIETPFEGDDFVVVKQAVPGATIRVWAADAGEEIGDGAGALIALTRPLVFNELLTITQQVGKCFVPTGYSIRVQ